MTVILPTDPTNGDTVSIRPAEKEASPKPLPPADILFVWDFDWTIANCNSDEYVPASFLGTAEMERRLRAMIEEHGPEKWHDCVSSLVNACLEEKDGSSRQDVCDAAARMPYLTDVRGSLEDVANDARCGQAIISDGNTDFIHAFVKKNEMESYFSHGIETNVGSWDVGESSGGSSDAKRREEFVVVHQSTKYGGHTCKKCPPNLCKSQVLLDILSRTETKRPRIVYAGDGSNDVCPAINVLDKGDVLLARHGKRDHNPNVKSGPQTDEENAPELSGDTFPILKVLERRKKEGMVPKCRICEWNTGKDLRCLVQSILDES